MVLMSFGLYGKHDPVHHTHNCKLCRKQLCICKLQALSCASIEYDTHARLYIDEHGCGTAPFIVLACLGDLSLYLTRLPSLQVPADEVVEEKQEPKIDFTYSGQQKLDLGFGPSGSRPAQPVQALSWARLRQVSTAIV